MEGRDVSGRLAASLAALTQLLLLVALSSCGSDPDLTVALANAVVTDGLAVTATAECAAPSVRIGGGFLLQPDNSNNGMVVRGSHPDSANGWTVEAANTTPDANRQSFVTAVAYCLNRPDLRPSAMVEAAAQTVRTGSFGEKARVRATCPPGSILTGGGFGVDGDLSTGDAFYNAGVEGSAPFNNGWEVDAGEVVVPPGSRQYRVFAVCTSASLRAGVIEQVNVTPPGGAMTSIESTCPADHFATAGGFLLNPTAAADASPSTYTERAYRSDATPFSKWLVQGSSLSEPLKPILAEALCIPRPPRPAA